MRISTYTFNKYLSQTYIDDFEGTLGRAFKNKDITFLTFNKWKVFYEADPDNWKFHHDDYAFNRNDCIYFPYYIYVENGGNSYRLIKFPTKREYKKFYRFYRKSIEHNLDGRENQQEILELAQIIGEKAKIRTEEAQRELTEGYKNLLSMTCNSDDIQTYFAGKDLQLTPTATIPALSSVYYPNSVPYKVTIKNKIKLYKYYADVDCMSEYLFYSCKPGTYVISEEKLVRGYVYCRIKSEAYNRQNEWIRLSDIDGKESI
jgi:hypothetical protein